MGEPSKAEPSKGLPMTSKWNPEKLARETAELQALESKPFFSQAVGYIKRTGPGLLQSAMTLGAGSAAASVMAGASFGYALLWVQPVAMFLGICMLGALGNVVLTTGERPYRAFSRELHISIAFLWALGTIVASVIWHFPQYGLAAGAAWDLTAVFGVVHDGTNASLESAVRWGAGLVILALSILTTWNYGSGGRGIKIYEWFLRAMIGLVILSFGVVVVSRAMTGNVDWAALWRGFTTFTIPKTEGGLTVVLGAIGAAVGINMTFLYPYSLLAKGWGEHHKKLSRWDLVMSMFLPFVIVTSLVIIAMASTIYDPAADGLRKDLAPIDAARALSAVMGSSLGRIIFDLGLIGMTCGAISTHMVVCGFTVCEMFGLEYTVARYRMFTLVPAIGILGVVTKTPLWLPVAASAICLTMLPIAYIAFFLMNNKRSYIGDAVGQGWKRAVFNVILLVAIAVATIGAAIKVKQNVVDKLWPATSAAAAPAASPAPTAAEEKKK